MTTENPKSIRSSSVFDHEMKIRLATTLWLFLFTLFILSTPILYCLGPWINLAILLLSAFATAIIVAFFKIVCVKLFDKSFFNYWAQSSAALFFIISTIIATPFYYFAYISKTAPAIAPQITLSNQDKTVVFQGMQHVASENFFKSVYYDAKRALADDYVIFYESVIAETEDSSDFVNNITSDSIGSNNVDRLYASLAETCNLHSQDAFIQLLYSESEQNPGQHYITDVTAEQLQQEYQRRMATDPSFREQHSKDFQDNSKSEQVKSFFKLLDLVSSRSTKHKRLIGHVCRGILNMAHAKSSVSAKPFDSLILDFRDRVLVDRINQTEHDKIFIIYGANHFKGVFQGLRKQDPRWQITDVKWQRTIDSESVEFSDQLQTEDS